MIEERQLLINIKADIHTCEGCISSINTDGTFCDTFQEEVWDGKRLTKCLESEVPLKMSIFSKSILKERYFI